MSRWESESYEAWVKQQAEDYNSACDRADHNEEAARLLRERFGLDPLIKGVGEKDTTPEHEADLLAWLHSDKIWGPQ